MVQGYKGPMLKTRFNKIPKHYLKMLLDGGQWDSTQSAFRLIILKYILNIFIYKYRDQFSKFLQFNSAKITVDQFIKSIKDIGIGHGTYLFVKIPDVDGPEWTRQMT